MSPTLPQRPLRVQSDARLIELARRGEAAAFEALVRRHRRQLHGYCRRFGLGDAQAEDALQQGLLHAWRALRRGDDVRDVKSWLYRVVHNAALDALRRSGGDTVELDESVHGDVEVSAAAELDRRLAVHATLTELAALPQMQREALVRTAVHGDSHEQVASALGLSHAAVRGLVHRARLAMRAAAGALVPERVLQSLVRWGVGAGAAGAGGAPELATGGSGGGGMLAVLAKSGAILATGGVLAGGLLAVQHGHAGSGRAAGRRAESASAAGPRGGAVGATGSAAGEGLLIASTARPNGTIAASALDPRSRSWHVRVGSRRSTDLHTGRAPTSRTSPQRTIPGGSTGRLAPVSVSPRDYARQQQSAAASPPTVFAPSAPPPQDGTQALSCDHGGRLRGSDIPGGADSTPNRSSSGSQSSGGAQQGGDVESHSGDSSNAHVADSSGGRSDTGGADGMPAHFGSGAAGDGGGDGADERSEGAPSGRAEQGGEPQDQTPDAGGSGKGGSRENSEGSPQQDS